MNGTFLTNSARQVVALVAPALFAAVTAQAAIVWDGPMMAFTEPAGGLGSDPSNQDRLTADVWITRNVTRGLFNAFSEASYTHLSSPAGTEWAYGDLANYATLTYTSWEGMFGGSLGGGPHSTINRPSVVHLINEDIYLSVTMTNWGGSLGGFSYLRSTPHGTVFPEPVQIAVSGNQIILTWNNPAFNLQSSTNVAGPYTTISGATSPYTNAASGKQLYFRLIY
jgi:hypothetical protein